MATQIRSDAVGLWFFVHVLVVATTTVVLVTNSRSQGMGWSLWILYYPLVVCGLQALFVRRLAPDSRKPIIVAMVCIALTVIVVLSSHVYSMLLLLFAFVPWLVSHDGASPWFTVYLSTLALGSGALVGLVQWWLLRGSWVGARVLLPIHAGLGLFLSRWPSAWDALVRLFPQLPGTTPSADLLLGAASGLIVAALSGLALLRLDQRAVTRSMLATVDRPQPGRR